MLRFPARLALLCLVVFALTGCKEATLGPELSGTLEGRVLDFHSGDPIQGAGVTTAPPTGAVVTDEDGRFIFDDIPAGSYTITARRVGYAPNTATVSVRENRVTQATVFLEEADADSTEIPSTALRVDVLNWANRTRGDSTFVRVEYRVRNEGTTDIAAYEVYFQIATTGDTFYEERSGTDLRVGQFDIENFEKFILNNTAVDVRVDTFWIAEPSD